MAQSQPQMPQMPQPPMPHMPQMPQIPMQQVSQMQQHSQMQQSPQMAPQITQMQRQAFSQPLSPSPTGTPQPQYPMPPNKRPRTETGPAQQQQQTYLSQQYIASPQNQATSPSAASPNYAPSPSAHLPQNYASHYANGQGPLSMPTPTSTTTPVATPTLHLPDARQSFTPSPSTPAAPMPPNAQQQYTNATMIPIATPPPPIPGVMGPPSRPADRPTREYEYDVSDSLAGTGIDLRAEEQALADYYAGSFAQEARTGLPANTPGGKGSMYGAGWANQPAQAVDGVSQDQFAAEAAQRAWDEAAQRLATSRSNEMKEPFVEVPTLHYRFEKIAKEHGISLNLDLKNAGSMGKFKHPMDFPQPRVTVTTKTGPDGAMVSTKGSFIPHDAFLADQLALLSIATKHRIRELIEEAAGVAAIRQTTSNGEIPDEWVDVAVPLQTGLDSLPEPESAVSPRTNPLKRSFDEANALSAPSTQTKLANHITKAIRDAGEGDRKIEDARLKKRQKRLNPEPAAAGSRSGSVAPGTPGGVAPEAEIAKPAKKDKKGAARMAEASSTASANQTLSTMMGGFGGRKKGKQYSWMTAGGSGANTPNRMNTPGTPGGVVAGAAKVLQEARLTLDGKTRWGTWRENIQGKNIQLRDWVAVLEMEKAEFRALQSAYAKLDAANAK